VTAPGRRLLEHRSEFLSRLAGDSFGKYGLAQLHRIRTHRRWLLSPPARRPERADFGLPERPTIPKDQQGALESMSQDGRVDESDLPAGFLQLLDKERRYRGAQREWQQYQEWTRNRNPARAELERRHGYDTKHAMHLVRLLKMAVEILTTARVIVRRPDHEELRAIRGGSLSFDALLERAEGLGARVREAAETSTLPERPDEERLDALCSDIVSEVHEPG
jgi:hypothetical protein